MTIRLYIDTQRAGRQLRTRLDKEKGRVLKARRKTAQDVVNYVVPKVRADIKRAGKFGPRWTNGFQGKVTEGGGFVKVSFTQAVPYWKVFQFGTTIRGKPMLWIPLSFARDAIGKKAVELAKAGTPKDQIRQQIQTQLGEQMGNWQMTGVVNDMRLDAFYDEVMKAAKGGRKTE